MAKQKPAQKPEIDRALIHELAKLLDETGLTEIEIERAGVRVRVARGRDVSQFVGGGGSAQPAAPQPVAPTPAATAAAAAADLASHPGLVTSPMVGTAYLGAEPGAMPFVDVGSKVVAGDTLLIIEAMKTMNQIPAPRSGTVTRILIGDAQPVEFGEPLMIVE
jgi:acetyl-CoA carboxylase biotin carboxyl carrier protein